jgi:hypothetical protein
MKLEKNWETLYEKYSDLFVNRHKTRRESCLSFGVECDLGWYDLISSVCWMIKQHEDNIVNQTAWRQKENPDYKCEFSPVNFDQIKEKFGGLRIYFSGGDDYVEGLVSMAEAMSYNICEVCGERGVPNKEGWIRTLCEKCKSNRDL